MSEEIVTSKNSKSKILIVGAGPTGLILSTCLKRYGLNVDVVDKKSGPNDQSKALAISPMSQIQTSLIHGYCPLGSTANKVHRLSVHQGESKRLVNIDFKWLKSPIKSILVQTQEKTENELVDLAHKCGQKIDWCTKVVSLEAIGEKVRVKLMPECDSETNRDYDSVDYDYVIGCEGKYSQVRKFIGAVEQTNNHGMYLALADYNLKTDMSENSAHYFVFDDTFFVFVPLGKSIWRVVVKHDGLLPAEVDEHSVEKAVEKYFGENMISSKPIWFSHAPLYSMTVDKIGSQRVFLAGDAAHLYSPLGGTGMNTGIVDALNLGWKLAFHILGYTSNNAVIESYQEERLPSILGNAQATDQITKSITQSYKDESNTQVVFLPQMRNRNAFKHVLPLNASGLNTQYTNSSILNTNRPGAGQLNLLLVELALAYSSLCEESALGLINVFHLLDVDATSAMPLGLKKTCLAGMNDIAVCWDIDAQEIEVQTENDFPCVVLPWQYWKDFAAIGDLLVIRPDGFVSFVGRHDEFDMMKTSHQGFLKAV